MTKKHFIALADMLRQTKPIHEPTDAPYANGFADGSMAQWRHIRNELGDLCQSQSPAFNRDRWLGYIAGTNGKNGGAK